MLRRLPAHQPHIRADGRAVLRGLLPPIPALLPEGEGAGGRRHAGQDSQRADSLLGAATRVRQCTGQQPAVARAAPHSGRRLLLRSGAPPARPAAAALRVHHTRTRIPCQPRAPLPGRRHHQRIVYLPERHTGQRLVVLRGPRERQGRPHHGDRRQGHAGLLGV